MEGKSVRRMTARAALLASVAIIGIGLLYGCPKRTGPGTVPIVKIGVVQVASHPLLDAVREGFVQRMKELGYVNGRNVSYDFQNAQGDMTTAQAITQKFASDSDGLIFTIGTSPSQAAAKATSSIPIVFGAVTDPVSAGLVKVPSYPGANITGVSDLSPFEDQLKLLQRVVPRVHVVGMVYNAGESNSSFGVTQTKVAAKKLGLQVVTASISSTNEVMSAAQSLAGKVDAFYSGTDNTVVSALESLIKVAEENRKPLLAADPDSVQRGALLTIGVDYRAVGVQSADIADKILKGTKPGEIPVVYAPGSVLAINKAAATAQGVTLPPDVMAKATKVYERKEQPAK